MTEKHSASWARIEVVQRSKGQSAVARAAYHLATRLFDERRQEWHDYSTKGGVQVVGIFGWRNRNAGDLWNAAERAEKNKGNGQWKASAQTAREMRIALPIEIPDKDLKRLLRGYAMWLHERYGVAVQVAVHEPPREGSQNRHVHILMTTRRVDDSTETGLGEKARELDDRSRQFDKNGRPIPSRGSQEVRAMRDEWTTRVNRALDKSGSERGRVDMRSHKERAESGVAPPMRKTTHLGPARAAAARTHYKAVAEAEAAGKPAPDAPAWLARMQRDADLNRQLRSIWEEAMFEVTKHRSRQEEDQAEEILAMLGGLVLAFLKPTAKAAVEETPVPAKSPPEDPERAKMRAEFDVGIDPEDPAVGKELDTEKRGWIEVEPEPPQRVRTRGS
ncbi:MobA/MobL family protein [Sagittula sp.]|uniref:MobA/MobL family protein n=1 Tax=Sagittula sp. TaxID=2038081 RepID=UPI0035113FB2